MVPVPDSKRHGLVLRLRKSVIHLYRPKKTDFGKRSLKYRAAKFYNDLPEEILNLMTLADTIDQF